MSVAENTTPMDWNLKAAFPGDAAPGGFSVDLKLGGDSFNLSYTRTKRSRTSSAAPAAVSCLVDGCCSDLSTCREYHRRHKVCEMHSKTPEVTIRGQQQRFCQQCSRFHSLEEFDEGKRSCRKRLDGHNRRRRKPRIPPVSDFQGLQLSGSHSFLDLHRLHHQSFFFGSTSSCSSKTRVDDSIFSPVGDTYENRRSVALQGATSESARALSLLSSSQVQMQSSGIHKLQGNPNSMISDSSLHDNEGFDFAEYDLRRGSTLPSPLMLPTQLDIVKDPPPLPFHW